MILPKFGQQRLLRSVLSLGLVLPFSSVAVAQEKDELPPVVSKLPIKIYGFVKGDASYDSADMSVGNFARWVEPDGSDQSEVHFTARETRLGMIIDGPEGNGLKSSARIEVDFYQSGTAENSSSPRMRHAHVNLDWKNYDLTLLAGQTSDVISPLVPKTVNYTVAWWVGDIGFRRNQVRVSKGFKLGESSKLLTQFATSRSNNGNVGYQVRAAFSFAGVSDKKTTLGVSGHSAREDDGANTTDSWSGNVDLTLPLGGKTTVKAEAFVGENLDAYVGGIGQGVNGAGDEIESMGYWAAINHRLSDRWELNAGYGSEEPEDDDLDSGARSKNTKIWANVFFKYNKATDLAFEIAQFDTEYKDLDDEDGFRVQAAVILKF